MRYVNATVAWTLLLASCGGADAGVAWIEEGHGQPAAPPSTLAETVAAEVAPGSGQGVAAERLPAPALEPLPESTWRVAVTVRGVTVPMREVVVAGELSQGVGRADAEGAFAIGVELSPQGANTIRVTAIDPYGVASEEAVAVIEQDAETVRTRMPIVLHHGYMGFRELVGVSYWWDIPEHLEALGFDARTTEVPPLATIEERASHLVELVRRTTSGRIHLFGHSMGGLDSRYAVSLGGLDGQVATVTTVGTPHRGSPVADRVLAGRDQLASEWLLDRLGIPAGGLGDLTVAKAVGEFNVRVLDVPGVEYFSWSSVADPFGLQTGAPLNPLFAIPYAIVEREEGENDGLVSVSSATWGTHLGNVAADHLDQVGHLLGLTDDFDHLAFWQSEALRLEELERREAPER